MSKRDVLPFTTTLHVRDSCLCLHTQRAARAIARRFDDALRPAHLTSGQFSLLMSLNRPVPPRIGAVAALLAMDRSTLTANLKPLQRRGLVTMTVDAADRRGRRLVLAPAGRVALAAAVPLWEQMEAGLEQLVGDADRLRAELHALSQASEARPPHVIARSEATRQSPA